MDLTTAAITREPWAYGCLEGRRHCASGAGRRRESVPHWDLMISPARFCRCIMERPRKRPTGWFQRRRTSSFSNRESLTLSFMSQMRRPRSMFHLLEGNLQRLQIRTGKTERASEVQCAESGTLPNHPQECVTELPVLECESHTAGARQQPPQVQHAQKMRSEMVTAETEQDMIWERVTEEEEDPWRELGMDDACHESVELGENDVWLGRGDVVSFGSLKRWIRRLTCLQLKWHPIRLTYCCRRISWSERAGGLLLVWGATPQQCGGEICR